MAADHRAVEEQHRHIEAVAAPENRIGVDVHHFDRRQWHASPERLQLGEHLLAEVAVAPVDYSEDGALQCRGGVRANGPPGSGASEAGGGADPDAFSAFTAAAMKRTVCGGTSPTAVTL